MCDKTLQKPAVSCVIPRFAIDYIRFCVAKDSLQLNRVPAPERFCRCYYVLKISEESLIVRAHQRKADDGFI